MCVYGQSVSSADTATSRRHNALLDRRPWQTRVLQLAVKRKRRCLLSQGMSRKVRKSFSLVPGSPSF